MRDSSLRVVLFRYLDGASRTRQILTFASPVDNFRPWPAQGRQIPLGSLLVPAYNLPLLSRSRLFLSLAVLVPLGSLVENSFALSFYGRAARLTPPTTELLLVEIEPKRSITHLRRSMMLRSFYS